jgi:hypothetical protein
MNELLDALRAAAAEELSLLEASDAAPSEVESERLDQLLELFFAAQPPSETWLVVVEDLALREPAVDGPPGAAAKTAAAPRLARPVTVEGALEVPEREARQHLQAAFGLGIDAAEELLERPAAALAQRQPRDVRNLAELASRPVGELFADIASSWRASSGYVYAYRPGEVPDKPAVSAASNEIATLIDWGEALLS